MSIYVTLGIGDIREGVTLRRLRVYSVGHTKSDV